MTGPYGGPPPRSPGHLAARPATVTAAGVITIVMGGIGALGVIAVGVLLALVGLLAGAMAEGKSPSDAGTVGDELSSLIVLVAVALVVLGVAYFVFFSILGVRVLRRGRVARVTLAVLNVISLVLSLAGAGTLVANGLLEGFVVLVVQMAPTVAILVLLFTGGANEWFARRPDEHPSQM